MVARTKNKCHYYLVSSILTLVICLMFLKLSVIKAQPSLGVNAGDARTWQYTKIRMEAPNETLINAGYLLVGSKTLYFVAGSTFTVTIVSISDQEVTTYRNATYLLINGTKFQHDSNSHKSFNRSALTSAEYLLMVGPYITTNNATLLKEKLNNIDTTNTSISWFNFTLSNGLLNIQGEHTTPDNNRHFANRTYDLNNGGWLVYSYDKAWRPSDLSVYLEVEFTMLPSATQVTRMTGTNIPIDARTPSFESVVTVFSLVMMNLMIRTRFKQRGSTKCFQHSRQ